MNSNITSVKFCKTNDMLADIMTKGLPRIGFQRCRDQLGVKEVN